jgi:hypothetical protein
VQAVECTVVAVVQADTEQMFLVSYLETIARLRH